MKIAGYIMLVLTIIGLILLLGFLLGESVYKEPIGGERDEHGCLSAAGYSWDEEIGACIRQWELDEEQRRAAKIAVAYVVSSKYLTIVEVKKGDCEGCFIVTLEKGEEREQVIVNVEDWGVPEI